MDSMKKSLKTQILLFSQKQFNLLIKYLSFGKEKINQSHYLLKSNIDEFIKNLFILVLRSKKNEDEQIWSNFKNCLEILDESGFNEEYMEEEEFEDNEGYNGYERENKYKKLWKEVNDNIINEI